MKKIIFLSLLLLSNTKLSQPCTLGKSQALTRLLDYFHLYKLNKIKKVQFHAGDLIDHSLWSCRAAAEWFDKKHPWTDGIAQYKDLIILGSLLHDVGKAGDHQFFYGTKHTHPCDGYQYLCNTAAHQFKLENKHVFDFKKLYQELFITPQEQKILAILVAMHWDFGLIMKNMQNTKTTLKQECTLYLNKLTDYCKKTNFNNGHPTEELLLCCIAVSAADIRGIQPVSYFNGTLIKLLGKAMATCYNYPCYKGLDIYKEFNIEQKGLVIREELKKMIKKKSS